MSRSCNYRADFNNSSVPPRSFHVFDRLTDFKVQPAAPEVAMQPAPASFSWAKSARRAATLSRGLGGPPTEKCESSALIALNRGTRMASGISSQTQRSARSSVLGKRLACFDEPRIVGGESHFDCGFSGPWYPATNHRGRPLVKKAHVCRRGALRRNCGHGPRARRCACWPNGFEHSNPVQRVPAPQVGLGDQGMVKDLEAENDRLRTRLAQIESRTYTRRCAETTGSDFHY